MTKVIALSRFKVINTNGVGSVAKMTDQEPDTKVEVPEEASTALTNLLNSSWKVVEMPKAIRTLEVYLPGKKAYAYMIPLKDKPVIVSRQMVDEMIGLYSRLIAASSGLPMTSKIAADGLSAE